MKLGVSVFDDHQVMGPSWHSECGGRIQQHRHRVLHRCSPHVYSSLCRTKDNISSCHWHCNRSNLTVWGFCWQNLTHSDISSLPKAGSWWTGNAPHPCIWCWRFASLALFGPQLVNVDLHVLSCISKSQTIIVSESTNKCNRELSVVQGWACYFIFDWWGKFMVLVNGQRSYSETATLLKPCSLVLLWQETHVACKVESISWNCV